MIRVNIIEDERIVRSVVETAGKCPLIAWAQENEKSPGHCVFFLTGEIKDIIDKDDVFELLVRSTLNCLDLRGIKTAFCGNEALFDGLKRLGFKESARGMEVDIKSFFKPCCSH